MEVIKQEISEETCGVKIENNILDDALLDNFKYEIKKESNVESTDYALKEFPIKTEIEQDGNTVTCFKEKQKTTERQCSSFSCPRKHYNRKKKQTFEDIDKEVLRRIIHICIRAMHKYLSSAKKYSV
uniref:Uncharacterized protein LOC114347202 n=1 Tax=Diabrotica virgifera virgifera TaxID=50390 RepID=A0A6P7H5B7_DIAVI